MNSYYINKKKQKISFDNLKEPYKSAFNRVKNDSEVNGYGVIIEIQELGTYDTKGLTFWFRNIETRETSEIFILPKDLNKFNFSLKLADWKM